MKKIFRLRLLCAVLVLILVPEMFIVDGIAAEVVQDECAAQVADVGFDLSRKEKNLAVEEVRELETLGILEEGNLIDIDVEYGKDNQPEMEYTVDYGEYVNEISDVEYSDGNVSFHSEQGNIQSDVLITNTGDIYLDGELVIYSVDIVGDVTGNESVVLNDNNSWFVSTCPDGTTADYIKYVRTESCSDVKFATYISNTTESAFIAVLCSLAGVGGIASFCAGAAYSFICEYAPTSKGMSYRALIYTKSGGAFIKRLQRSVWEYNYTWYTKTKYEGEHMKDRAYLCKEYY